MSLKRRDRDYLADVMEAIRRVIVYTADLSYETFLEDAKTQDAVLRNIQVIGEAVKRLSARVRQAYPGVPWREMAGMRDKVIHDYFGVNYDIVWTVASRELPVLQPKIEDIQRQLEA